MGIIGNNTIGNLSHTFTGTNRHIWLPSFDYTPTVDETVSTVNVFMASESASEGTVQVGVYRVSDGALIESAQITIPANAAEAWYEAAMPGAETLLSGVAYRVALGDPTVDVTIKHSNDQNGYGGFGSTLPATFTQEGTQSRSYSIYATTAEVVTAADYTVRKGSQFTAETTLSGTVTAATLNGQAITVDSQVGTTVTLTDSDGSITTSGEYPLVLTDDSADPDETITVQVNVYGVAPANNPVQKDGAALASLTNVELRVSAGATLAGSELFYTGTATTDASGNLGNIDLSSTAAADTDPVLLSIRTAAGDSIITAETVGLI